MSRALPSTMLHKAWLAPRLIVWSRAGRLAMINEFFLVDASPNNASTSPDRLDSRFAKRRANVSKPSAQTLIAAHAQHPQAVELLIRDNTIVGTPCVQTSCCSQVRDRIIKGEGHCRRQAQKSQATSFGS